MKTVNNNIFIEMVKEVEEGLIDTSSLKKDFKKGTVLENTEVYITNDEKMTLTKGTVLIFEANCRKQKYEDEKYFIPFNSVIACL